MFNSTIFKLIIQILIIQSKNDTKNYESYIYFIIKWLELPSTQV
jgi:hypothetical protein